MSETLTALAGAPLLAFVVSTLLAYGLSRGKAARIALDHPNARSLHAKPVPRTGGIAVMAAAGAAWSLGVAEAPAALLAALCVVAAISLVDDFGHTPAALRLIAHVGAAAYFVHQVAGAGLALPAQAVLAVGIAWLVNLYNFMDGSDGLAGGMAFIGFVVYALAAIDAGNFAFAATNLIIAASAAGFLVFNFHPAKIFLGDVGAVPLGFLAGALGVLGWHGGAWPLWFPVVVFSPFIVDASVTLARRLWHRERVWRAHRDHYYQRLVQMGWGHKRTAWVEYALMAATGGVALLALGMPDWARVAVLAGIAATYAIIIALIGHAWRSRTVVRQP